MPILDINEIKVESRWHRLKRKLGTELRVAMDWVKDNPVLATTAAAGATGIARCLTRAVKGVSRNMALRQERYNKERYIYDRSLGMYLHTNRKLTNRDWEIIMRRRQNGEKLSDILTRMGILD